jgi:ATP-dependent HslUV protease subunit HslV
LLITNLFVSEKAAARAQMDNPDLSAEDVAKKAMQIASEMCIYTNDNFLMESLAMEKEKQAEDKDDSK